MSTESIQSAPSDPHDLFDASKTPQLAPQPQEPDPRLKDLAEMVAALRARRQASLGRWNTPQ